MTSLVGALFDRGVISALDRHFASTVGGFVHASEEVMLGAALASRAVARGHVCADLRRLVAAPLLNADDEPVTDITFPPFDALVGALGRTPLVGDGTTPTPLVLDQHGRLYLYRYYQYQRALAERLIARAAGLVELDAERVRQGMDRLFLRVGKGRQPDRQRLAAAVAISRRLAVISGGPGTGKTTVVVRLLALLQESALATLGRPLSTLLLAPTGKAAQRLGETTARQVELLGVDERVRAALPMTASTLHRALGYQPRTPTRFRYGEAHPLPAEVVVVDEASMVDLALMAKLAAAVAPSARLILLGDKDQLASVEAGAILGDICGGRSRSRAEPTFSKPFAAHLSRLTGERTAASTESTTSGVVECIVHLNKSHRYDEKSGIFALARAINAGEAEEAVRVLRGERDGQTQRALAVDVALIELTDARSLEEILGPTIDDSYGKAVQAADPRERLLRFGRFRILCPHRRGSFGVDAVNTLVEERLVRRGLLRQTGEWYDGRPIMVTRNDYQLNLFNGDIGVLAARQDRPGAPLAAFFAGAGSGAAARSRVLLPARLPPHETVFAMTVHKSQGSEFDRVALVIPEQTSPLLTRELIYTAVSRARARVEVYGTAAVLAQAIGRRVERASGLEEMLFGAPHLDGEMPSSFTNRPAP